MAAFSLLIIATVLVPTVARAANNCGVSSGHTLCVTAASTLSGEQAVTVTDSPNNGLVFATWVPSGGAAVRLIQTYAPSASTNDYSFVWPTQKYLDDSGTLWGATADTTQPTLGNHENANIPAWMDYWRGHPLYTSFTWGGVLFLDLNSSQNLTVAHAEYNFTQSVLTAPNVPACVVAFFH